MGSISVITLQVYRITKVGLAAVSSITDSTGAQERGPFVPCGRPLQLNLLVSVRLEVRTDALSPQSTFLLVVRI